MKTVIKCVFLVVVVFAVYEIYHVVYPTEYNGVMVRGYLNIRDLNRISTKCMQDDVGREKRDMYMYEKRRDGSVYVYFQKAPNEGGDIIVFHKVGGLWVKKRMDVWIQ